jgi:thiol:disulfide interchange protein DsbD
MGVPLILVAVFGNKLLPKAGLWMDRVKIAFGFILLAAPIFLLERLIPESWSVTLWGVLGIAFFSWLYHLKNSLEFAGWKQSLVGILAVLGLLSSALPIYHLWFDGTAGTKQQAVSERLNFIRVHSVEELEQQLVIANKANKPVLLDFYADWCVSCKEFDKYTFHHADVASKLSQFVLLQADVTKNSPQDIALFKRLRVMGLPTIDFWDSQGNYITDARLTGFIKATPFLHHLDAHQLLESSP